VQGGCGSGCHAHAETGIDPTARALDTETLYLNV
jgi:hypothetical protein